MGFLSILSMAHQWIAERVQPGDIVIDATAGGGVDTLKLAELVGPRGTVHAFDIQRDALDRTQERLRSLEESGRLPQVRLHLRNHAQMAEAVGASAEGKVAAVMFNLGYLPGGDESVITVPTTTVAALDAALSLLRRGGIVTVALYPGHPGGAEEAAIVADWAAKLPGAMHAAVLYRQPQRDTAPYLIAVEKR
ncbi:methyltransferase domain-containing protein [Paenibacillus glycanilyticus]|uniref:tRNA (mnm(5)s(2)U34)-methyltransferase n=1 Tax=Paenibacillus glycanilyticus TaxID=126569 RepID=UPI00203AAA8F|nr:class I SAM-dependent methyltransferase [Paenibacillus glycanilyticus]MCM3628859.1 methyltransferase domain-containing protein [Paenibacillus glycanilyticus]